MSSKYVEIPGSFRAAPPELTPIAAVHHIKPSEPIEVSVYLKDRGADLATKTGLSVVRRDPARRLVKLAGSLENMEAAFRTKLHYYSDGKVSYRARAGALSAPADIVDRIEAVVGLDTRPIAKPKLRHHADPHTVVGHSRMRSQVSIRSLARPDTVPVKASP
jgi:kumamolisin